MDQTQFNAFDLCVAFVLLASGVFAFRRGLLREVMALGTWIVSSIFAFTFYPIANPFFRDHIENTMLADAATGIALFSLAVVILVPLGEYLAGMAKNPTLNSIDRSLGFIFGVLRGFIIACLIFLAMSFVWPADEDSQPEWLAEARTKPALAYGVDLIRSFVPEDPDEAAQEKLEESREAAMEAIEDAKRLEDISTSVPVYSGKSEEVPFYGEDLRDGMDDLLDRNDDQ